MTLADAHIHLFQQAFPGTGIDPAVPGAELAAYERLRAEFGIHEALVVGYEGDAFAAGNNVFLRRLASGHPWMSTVAYLPPGPPTESHVAAVLDAGHVGISLYLTDARDASAVGAWSDRVWSRLERARAIVSLNAAPATHAHVVDVARRRRDARFVWSHLGLPGAHSPPDALAQLVDAAALDNCWVKLSGLYAIDPVPPHAAAARFVQTLLEAFGADRMLWGSDFAPALAAVRFADTVATLDLVDEAFRTAVGSESLRRLLDR